MRSISPTLPRILAIVLLAATLQGCIAAAVGTGAAAANAAHDRRTVGNIIDDQNIELSALQRINQNPQFDDDDRIKVISYNGIVLLLGETSAADNKALATEVIGRIQGVRKVVNEMDVTEKPGFGTRTGDTYLTSKVKTALLTKNPVAGFDMTRIKVVTVRDTVYLMGLVTPEEGDAVADVARNVNGVEKVVKVFEYVEIQEG